MIGLLSVGAVDAQGYEQESDSNTQPKHTLHHFDILVLLGFGQTQHARTILYSTLVLGSFDG
jgi:hypothetical protein